MRILGHFERFGPPAGGGILTTATILRELARRLAALLQRRLRPLRRKIGLARPSSGAGERLLTAR